MLTKEDVRVWLGKCQTKAMNVVEKELSDALAELSKKYPQCTKDYKAILDCKEKICAFSKQYNTVFNVLRDTDIEAYDIDTKKRFRGIDLLVVNYAKLYDSQEYEKIKELVSKVDKVRQEYNDLKDICQKMRKAEKAVKYLQDLGFNTETLIHESISVDKKFLFVCGDNKPDIKKQE